MQNAAKFPFFLRVANSFICILYVCVKCFLFCFGPTVLEIKNEQESVSLIPHQTVSDEELVVRHLFVLFDRDLQLNCMNEHVFL